jgi:hypothetical protein
MSRVQFQRSAIPTDDLYGVPQSLRGKFRDSTLNLATTASFHILSNLLVTYRFRRRERVLDTERLVK